MYQRFVSVSAIARRYKFITFVKINDERWDQQMKKTEITSFTVVG